MHKLLLMVGDLSLTFLDILLQITRSVPVVQVHCLNVFRDFYRDNFITFFFFFSNINLNFKFLFKLSILRKTEISNHDIRFAKSQPFLMDGRYLIGEFDPHMHTRIRYMCLLCTDLLSDM